LISPGPKKKPKSAYVRFAAELSNQMWQTDFTRYRLTRPDATPGADAEILCFIDDHSRHALSVTCHRSVTGPDVVAAFRQAVADQGIPASVLSDNGLVFTTRFAGGRAGAPLLAAGRGRTGCVLQPWDVVGIVTDWPARRLSLATHWTLLGLEAVSDGAVEVLLPK
jgi:Integrase core domain